MASPPQAKTGTALQDHGWPGRETHMSTEDYERGRRDMAKEVFALHEDTIERYHAIAERDTEGKQGAYARGRIIEAKSIAKAIGAILPPVSR